MRIIFATKPHLPLLGGAQLTTHFLAGEMIGRGHSVTVIALEPTHQLAQLAEPLPYELISSMVPEQALSELLATRGADCVVVGGYHDRTASWANQMLRAAAPVPTVFYLHDIGTIELAAEANGRIDRVVTVSEFLAGRVRRLGVEATCIEPIVDRRRYRVATSRRVALFINPVAQKGVDVAFALAQARPDITFAFVRCWPLDQPRVAAIEARAGRLCNVQVRHSVTDPRLLYGDARVLLVPSPYPEAWPRVAAEAQASGIPVIGSNVGGVAEAADGVGLFVEPDASIDRWEQALAALWDDEILYRKHVPRARKAAERPSISPRSVGDRFECLVRDLTRADGGEVVERMGQLR